MARPLDNASTDEIGGHRKSGRVQRLLLMTPGEATRDPRARRAAIAALELGLDVTVVCTVSRRDEPVPLGGVRIERVSIDGPSGALRQRGLGGMRPSRPLVRELRGLYRLVRLAARTAKLARAAWRVGPFDIVHANDLDTLPAGALLARGGVRLVYDAHEIYSAQETRPPRLYAAVALALERRLARRADVVVTTAEPFARELQARLRLPEYPLIVLNAPDSWPEPAVTPADGPLRIVYYAAADHAGRPLDDLIDAAELVPEATWTVHVVNFDRAQRTRELANRKLSQRVALLPAVAPDRLRDALAGKHVGLILQRPITPNDGLASPNKLFEYMMAGLAVVAPDLPALAPIVAGEGVGILFTPGSATSLAEAVRALAHNRSLVAGMQRRARDLALDRYNAESQRPVLRRAWRL